MAQRLELQISDEDRFYFGALPLLLAAAQGLSWDQFRELQGKDPHGMLPKLTNNGQFEGDEAQRDRHLLAASLAQTFFSLHGYFLSSPKIFREHTKATLQDAMACVDSIADELEENLERGMLLIPPIIVQS